MESSIATPTVQYVVSATYCIRYIHIALWVRKVVLNKLDGWFHFKRPVGSLCVVPPVCRRTGREEVLHQPDVELFWVKEFILVIVNILLLTGALLAFGMGIHL